MLPKGLCQVQKQFSAVLSGLNFFAFLFPACYTTQNNKSYQMHVLGLKTTIFESS